MKSLSKSLCNSENLVQFLANENLVPVLKSFCGEDSLYESFLLFLTRQTSPPPTEKLSLLTVLLQVAMEALNLIKRLVNQLEGCENNEKLLGSIKEVMDKGEIQFVDEISLDSISSNAKSVNVSDDLGATANLMTPGFNETGLRATANFMENKGFIQVRRWDEREGRGV